MRVSMLVRWGTALTAALMLAACSDTATAPPSAPAARPHLSDKQFEQWLLDNGGASRDGRGRNNKTDSVWTKTFVVDPTTATTIKVGDHSVYFPANSICDPATSSYGPDHWDEACTPLDHAIDFHAEVRRNDAGQSWVDFTPAVRFVPTDDPNQTVWVMMKAGTDVTTDNYADFGMQWMPNGTPDVTVNEATVDGDLKTYVDLDRDVVFRRVKHFSGYIICTAKTSVDDALKHGQKLADDVAERYRSRLAK